MNRPSIAFMRGIISAFYALDGNITGGKLHIVLDDGNAETHHVEWCLQQATQAGKADAMFLAELLLQFTEDERAEILQLPTDWRD